MDCGIARHEMAPRPEVAQEMDANTQAITHELDGAERRELSRM